MLATGAELASLEERVRRALDGSNEDLPVLGHGEITLVLGCPAEDPRIVAKRLPPFVEFDRAESYGALVHEYVAALAQRGIDCVQSEFRVTRTDGGWAAYVLQPRLAPDQIGPAVLRRRQRDDTTGGAVRELLDQIVAAIVAATDQRVGVDGQLSNWADTDEGLRYFDVTTPLLTAADGHSRLDLEALTSPLPVPLRPAVRRFAAPSIIANYHSPRSVLVDLAANLHKERLAQWVGAVLVASNAHLEQPITFAEANDHYRRDARTWEMMLRLRMADRWV
ncbi:MAG: DUF6206 family protein, partial [Microthrixaceae bacterium]